MYDKADLSKAVITYTIKNTEKIDENNFKVQIELNPNHQVFEGHFPNNPITPGVCMMQIIKEITEGFVSKDLFLSKRLSVFVLTHRNAARSKR